MWGGGVGDWMFEGEGGRGSQGGWKGAFRLDAIEPKPSATHKRFTYTIKKRFHN